MHVFIDESGDPGIHVDRVGTSPTFVVAGIIVRNAADMDQCREGIQAFRRDAGYRRPEFKFNQCDANTRKEFLTATTRLPWKFVAVAMNKARLSGPGFKFKESFYKYAVSLLLSNARPYLSDATVVFDRCGNRDFRRTMVPYVKRASAKQDGTDPIRRALAQASHSDDLLQLADMVAGAVARSYKLDKTDAKTYRAIVRGHELGVQYWPV